MGSALGAGRGADMLQQVLRAKFAESLQQQKLAEDIRQANMQNEIQRGGLDIQRGNLDLGNRRVTEDARQFDAGAPLREAQVTHVGAQTADLNRRPEEAQKQRDFTSGESAKGREFQGGQGDLNRSNALRIAGGNNATAIRIAKMNNDADAAAAAAKAAQSTMGGATEQQQNEVADALAIIQQLRTDPARASSTGPVQGRNIPFTEISVGALAGPEGNERIKALHNNLVDKLALAQAGKLKGQGQISNMERELLKNAATTLNMKLGDADYLKEMDKLEAQFKRMIPAGTTKKFPNGKTGVWDGQGWVQQ